MNDNKIYDIVRMETTRVNSIIVNTTGDQPDASASDGVADVDLSTPGLQTTLRAAMQEAERRAGADFITFALGGPSGEDPPTYVIRPATPLPTLTQPVTIDAISEAGKVVLDGENREFGGFLIRGANTTIRGLGIQNFLGHGIEVQNAGGQLFENNTIATGISSIGDGIRLTNAPQTTIRGNVLSGNGRNGVTVEGSSTTNVQIVGNIIGLSSDGQNPQPNDGHGIEIRDGAAQTTVGGNTAALGNVIGSNRGHGVYLHEARQNTLLNNKIGISSEPVSDFYLTRGNAGRGILIENSPQNQVGRLGARNYVVANGGANIEIVRAATTQTVVAGNYVGLDPKERGHDSAAHSDHDGLVIRNAPAVVVGGGALVDSNWFGRNRGYGIRVEGAQAAAAQIQNNAIGYGLILAYERPNRDGGILIDNVSDVVIGGDYETTRNVIIGGSGAGITLRGAGTTNAIVQGNSIGTTLLGDYAVATDLGIHIEGASNNQIGGASPGQENVVFSTSWNVLVEGVTATHNRIQGNFLNVQRDGTSKFTNWVVLSGLDGGIAIREGASDNTIGGTETNEGNYSGWTQGVGVRIEDGEGNAILGNSIFGHEQGGIDLGTDGATPNDPLDADDGPNRRQNAPEILATVSGGSTQVTGILHSAPGKAYRIELFANPTDRSMQGEELLHAQEVTTNAQGEATFQANIPGEQVSLTATATDPDGNTSEFAVSPLVVNSTGDEEDADPSDGVADVDLGQAGLQTTLRAAMQEAFRRGGPDRITFAIDTTELPVITTEAALPKVNGSLVIDGSTKPGAGHVRLVDGANDTSISAFHLLARGRSSFTLIGMTVEEFDNAIFSTEPVGVLVQDVRLVNNQSYGIFLHSSLLVQGTVEVSGNGEGGIRVQNAWIHSPEEGTHLLKVQNNGGVGVHVIGGEARLPTSIITHNEGGGIRADRVVLGMPGATSQISENIGNGVYAHLQGIQSQGPLEVHGNHQMGLYADEGNIDILDSASVLDNRNDGIQAKKGSVHADELTVERNRGAGIRVHGEGRIHVSAGSLTNNRKGDARIGLDGQVIRSAPLSIRDADGDGATDAFEFAASPDGDFNGNGRLDADEPGFRPFLTLDDRLLAVQADHDLQDFQVQENPSPLDSPVDRQFPTGFFSFRLEDLAPGALVNVEFELPPGQRATEYWKYSPSPGNAEPHWWQFTFDGTTGARISPDGRIVQLTLQDGGRGDADGEANGVIVDPGAAAIVPGLAVVEITHSTAAVEGTPVTITVTTDPPASQGGLTYEFDFDNDGEFDATNATGQIEHAFPDNGDFSIVVRVTADGDGGATTAHHDLVVANVAPSLAINSQSGAVPGAPVAFTFMTTDPGAADQAADAPRTLEIDWNGDGVFDEVIANAAPAEVRTHTFAAFGAVEVHARVTDKDGAPSPVVAAYVTLAGTGLVGCDLFVSGTSGDDQIRIVPASRHRVGVILNGRFLGNYAPTGSIHLFGHAGNDLLWLHPSLSRAGVLDGGLGQDLLFGARGNDTLFGGSGDDTAWGAAGDDRFWGGAGNDTFHGDSGNDMAWGGNGRDLLYGGAGNDLLLGQSGSDRLFGEAGRDLLFGGHGADRMWGGAGDDLLVAGEYVEDPTPERMAGLRNLWAQADDYSVRVAALMRDAGGFNPFLLRSEGQVLPGGRFTLDLADGADDELWGGADRDWFWGRAAEADRLLDLLLPRERHDR